MHRTNGHMDKTTSHRDTEMIALGTRQLPGYKQNQYSFGQDNITYRHRNDNIRDKTTSWIEVKPILIWTRQHYI